MIVPHTHSGARSTPTHIQAHLIAQELTLRRASDNPEKLTRALVEARVDLNPHQVDAALFAFKNPLSKGAILADEVGLGKTIEAGLLLTQYWAEGRRRLLVLCPASLRTQWRDELADKFYLDAVVLDARAARDYDGNPFDQASASKPRVVIASYHFASRMMERLMTVPWDLAVLDEAHRLRNVYKGTSIATNIKAALAGRRKVLLTATPLQNSLNELYGLVSLVDEEVFGDQKTFSRMYGRMGEDGDRFNELKQRLAPYCHRTLRRQVREYVSYTERQALTQEFTPSQDEQDLYDMVTEYLQRDVLWALPNAQRQLIELMLRKLLASSTYAIAGALGTMVARLERDLRDAEAIAAGASPASPPPSSLAGALNDEELDGEFSDDDIDLLTTCDADTAPEVLSRDELDALAAEIAELAQFRDLAQEITHNAKGEALLAALGVAFERAEDLGAARKAVVFTESRRTQDYLARLLEANGYEGKIVRFAGTNTDPSAKAIYDQWRRDNAGTDRVTGSRAVDMRAALVDAFRGDDVEILIATEAAAEGINLQFCSIVVNYDLPWNPQRVEQRIGRCHRYGQRNDVLVVNFLNKDNAADVRVFELLSEKFELFQGVFGASDEVLGAIESGVDIERRIADIYRSARTVDEINGQFEQLQLDFAETIDEQMQQTRTKLIEHFDAQVHDRLKVKLEESRVAVSRHQERILDLLEFAYGKADAGPNDEIMLAGVPSDLGGPTLRYDSTGERGRKLRLGDPAVEHALQLANKPVSAGLEIVFEYTDWPVKAVEIEPLVAVSGELRAVRLSLESREVEEYLIVAAVTDGGRVLSDEQVARLMKVPATQRDGEGAVLGAAADAIARHTAEKIEAFRERSAEWMDFEYDKLDKWANDERARLRSDIQELDTTIRDLDREVRKAGSAPEKLALRKRKLEHEKKRDEAQRAYDAAVDDVTRRRDAMLDEIEQTLQAKPTTTPILTARWSVR